MTTGNRTISIFLTMVFIFGLFPPLIFSQPVPHSGLTEIKGFNKSVLDSHFSRADREINPERWLSQAALGITQAVCAWEMIALSLYDDPLLFNDARNSIEKFSNEEMEKRFSQWLLGRFFGKASEAALTDLLLMFDENQKTYSWHLDNEGNILFDDKTGDPLIIRPNDADREFSRDLLLWNTEAEEIIKYSERSFDDVMIILFPELLAYIPFELRESMSKVIFETAEIKNAAIKQEFENIAAREERIFSNRRTRDIWSLRSKSENEAARIITDKLIAETEETCRIGIEELNIKIEQAAAGNGDLAILGEEWLRIYKEQFDRGLKAWEDAEKRFFIRRVEWEQESLQLFLQGDESWRAAFNQFEEERQKWELKSKELFQAGELMFKNLSDDFEKNIAQAKKEFELNKEIRTGEGTTKVKALIDMYLICSSAAISSMDNVKFWQNQYFSNNKPNPEDGNFAVWLSGELEKNPSNTILLEIKKSYDMHISYKTNAIDARNRISENYAELFGTGALKDILSPFVSSEDFYLDEYQTALINARALVLYWEQKTDIANTVMSYAEELSAGRMTEYEGLRAWEEAKKAYNESLAAYETELKKLSSAGNDLRALHETLNVLAEKLLIEEEMLNKLNIEYAALSSASAANLGGNYLIELNIKYNILLERYKLFRNTGANSAYQSALEYGMMWGIAEQRENAEFILLMLAEETDLTEEEKISLVNEYNIIASWNEIWQNTRASLSLLFSSYGIKQPSYIPHAQDICAAISKKTGGFFSNTADFLNEFNKCFLMIPQWLDYEILNWKNMFIEYAAMYTFYNGIQTGKNSQVLTIEQEHFLNEYIALYNYISLQDDIDETEIENINAVIAELIDNINSLNYMIDMTVCLENIYMAEASAVKEKHWRQLLTADNIVNIDPLFTAISSRKDGIMADTFFYAAYSTNRINDAFGLLSQTKMYNAGENAEYYFDLYIDEASRVFYLYNALEANYKEISDLAAIHELSKLTDSEKEFRLRTIEEQLNAQMNIFKSFRNEYLSAAERFLEIGSLYDKQYNILKSAYENTERKRLAYEKQDAIQRWASTAYLNTDIIDPDNSKEKLLRAQNVLGILSDLYKNETSRSYEYPEYAALLSAYEKSFSQKLNVLETLETVVTEIVQEKINNENLYLEYQKNLFKLGHADQNYTDYISPIARSVWSVKDIITVKDGRLAFSADASKTLSGIDASKAEELNAFFKTYNTTGNEMFEISLFEESLRGLNQRMAGYLVNDAKYNQWGLARDYLVYSLIKANGDIKYLQNCHTGIGQMSSSGSLGKLTISPGISFLWAEKDDLYSVLRNQNVIKNFESIYQTAWDGLSQQERADLEYYVILTLYGGNDYFAGFSKIHTLDVYKAAEKYVKNKYTVANKEANNLLNIFILTIWAHQDMRDTNYSALKRIEPAQMETNNQVNAWILGLRQILSSTQVNSQLYIQSSERLALLEEIKKDGESVEWSDIYKNLLYTGKINPGNIDELKTIWEIMQKQSTGKIFRSVSDALLAMLDWTKNEEIKNKTALENRWLNDANEQKRNENNYLTEIDNYMEGYSGVQALKTAAENAFGKNSAAWKNHFGNLHDVLLNNLSLYLNSEFNFFSEFSVLGDEIILITAKTLENRYNAELAVRETEWRLTLKDLTDKYSEWQSTASLILENGRADWSENIQKMNDAYRQWNENFQSEYYRIDNEWAEVYLAGLEDKERWLQQAANAANQASSESFLSLLGTEGERLSRFMDTREPFGIRDAVPQAQLLMAQLLQSSGIAGMSNAFGSLNNIAGIASPLIRQGIGGISTWDTALVKIAASDLANKTNAEIADSETRKLAYNFRLTAEDAIKNLVVNVNSANESFRKSMDNIFIFNGLWTKSGNNYTKAVVKGSTLLTPVISKQVTVPGYMNFIMEPIMLQTNPDENLIASLDSIALRSLLENVFAEVQIIAADIFGINENPIRINRNGNEREQSPGKFGVHIGYVPADKLSSYSGTSREKMFYDEGAGELGRLMSEYTYWAVIDTKGSAELTLAPWDKRIWNDEGSWFSAPSLRTAGTIAASVVAGVFTAGGAGIAATIAISSSSAVAFGALDAAYGLKELDEIFFDIGKSILTNSVTTVGSSLFNGLTNTVTGLSSSALYKVAAQTAMTGIQTAATSLAVTAVNGFTYENGTIGYNTGVFKDNWNNLLSGTFSSMTSAFTSSGLTAINSGFDMSKLIGNKQMNKHDLQTLNGMLGSLAGQGVSYAMGNDFTVNILNLSQFTGGKYSSGLLELNLGRNGVSMNIGTGGANVSFDAIEASFRGIEVWNVNSQISKYGKMNNFDALIALRAQYGYGDNVQKSQLWEILSGNVLLNADGGDYTAQTTIINGQKVINLAGYQQGLNAEDQFRLATVIGHEAYRDGDVTDNNYLETRSAAMAHTEMAVKMLFGGEEIAFDQNLFNDLSAYIASLVTDDINLFNSYVDSSYDSLSDYWKLVMMGNFAGFEWDGELTYDLTAIGINGRTASLNDDILNTIWNLGSRYATFNEFKAAAGTFDTLNRNIQNFENTFNVAPNRTAAKSVFDSHWTSFINALQNVGASGLLAETAAKTMNLSGGPHIFANGAGEITSDYGMRAITWGDLYGMFQWHNAWDLGARGAGNTRTNIDTRLVASMNGTVALEFNQGHGIQLVTRGGNNESITYSHSHASSIRTFVELYSYNTVNLSGNVLTGIAKNTVIGVMGNTGTLSVDPHVDVIYRINGVAQNPALFYYRDENRQKFPSTDYSRLMSGFSGSGNNARLTYSDVLGIQSYLSTNSPKNYANNFKIFANNNPQYRRIFDLVSNNIMINQNNRYLY